MLLDLHVLNVSAFTVSLIVKAVPSGGYICKKGTYLVKGQTERCLSNTWDLIGHVHGIS